MSQHIRDDSDPRKYFAMLPHIADDDMDPYQYRLYGHYLRVCGANGGECWESVRTTATKAKMSVGKVVECREWLKDNGWISVDSDKRKTLTATILDRWADNIRRYSERSQDERDSAQCSPDEQECSPHERKRSPRETKKNSLRRTREEITTTSAAAEAEPSVDSPPSSPAAPVTEERRPKTPHIRTKDAIARCLGLDPRNSAIPNSTWSEIEQASRLLREDYSAYQRDADTMTPDQETNFARLMDDMWNYYQERIRINNTELARGGRAWWPHNCGRLRVELVRFVTQRGATAAAHDVRVIDGVPHRFITGSGWVADPQARVAR